MMDVLIKNLDTTAMVIGYPVLAVIVFLVGWFCLRIFRDSTKIINEMKYDRKKRKQTEDLSDVKSSLMLELNEDYEEDESPTNYHNHDEELVGYIPAQRHETLELPQLYNFQEDDDEHS